MHTRARDESERLGGVATIGRLGERLGGLRLDHEHARREKRDHIPLLAQLLGARDWKNWWGLNRIHERGHRGFGGHSLFIYSRDRISMSHRRLGALIAMRRGVYGGFFQSEAFREQV